MKQPARRGVSDTLIPGELTLLAQDGWLRLDAHILATPAIGDLNGDGHEELVVGVSWFFDREYYDDPVCPTAHASLSQASCVTHGSIVLAQ